MRKIIILMGPPGLPIKDLSLSLINKIHNRVSFLTDVDIFKNDIISLQDYFDKLTIFSNNITNIINDSNKNEVIVVSGFFTTQKEREYIYHGIEKSFNNIDKKYGIWIEDIGSNLEKNTEISKEMFDYFFSRRVSPIEAEQYTDIYYIINHENIGTSKKHPLIYSIEQLFDILGEECNETN